MGYWITDPIEATKEALGVDTTTAKALCEQLAEDDKREPVEKEPEIDPQTGFVRE